MLTQTNIEELTSKQLEAYLKRIKLNTELHKLTLDAETLNTLHKHHTLHIPFENLDVHTGASAQNSLIPLDLSMKRVFDKIVIQNRGGYCYEMNKLFASVLKTIGYEVYSHMAGVIWGFTDKMPPQHRMLTVALGNEMYLVDVGFGGPGQIDALKIVFNEEQRQGSHSYRLVKDQDNEIELQKMSAHGWKRLYAFDANQSYDENGYDSNNHYMSTDPDSIFVKQIICTRPLENGRISLVEDSFKRIIIQNNVEEIVEQRDHLSFKEFLDILENYFSISFPINTQLSRHNKQHIFNLIGTDHMQTDTSVKSPIGFTQNGAEPNDKIPELKHEETRKFHFFGLK